MANNNNGQHDFIEFVCKPVEDLYLASGERRAVRIKKGTEYRCSMLRDQHFSSLFRHYGKHNGVDKETLVFFFTEELMQELEGATRRGASTCARTTSSSSATGGCPSPTI